MRIISYNIVCALLMETCNGGWRETLKDIKQRAQEKFKRRQDSKNVLGYDVSEYPGTNGHYRNLNNEKWSLYYECLSAQERNLGHRQSISPIATEAFEGASVKLDCAICLSPENIHDIHEVDWYYALKEDDSLKLLEFDEHILVSPEDKTLMMYNLKLEQSGQYVCSLGQSLTSPYYLTVVRSLESNIDEVHPKTAKYGPYPKENLLLPQYNIRLTTEWGQWTPCSKCDEVGKHHKTGFCMVQYNQVDEIRRERSISKKHLEVLKIFSSGIPCESHILPEDIKKLPEVQSRKDEIMIGLCKETCKTQAVYEVKDEHGNVVERANNYEGIYSMEQGLQQPEPHIEKTLEYKKAHSDIILTCPGNLNTDASITWQIGQRIVVPELISKQSNGRIYVGLTDRIHIKQALISDTNIYSCWQNKELAGIIRLIVEKKIEFHLNHHIMMFAMIVILFTFFWVFTKAFFGRKYAKIKD